MQQNKKKAEARVKVVVVYYKSKARAKESRLLRAHWIIGPPFLDRKSLATMSNVGVVGG